MNLYILLQKVDTKNEVIAYVRPSVGDLVMHWHKMFRAKDYFMSKSEQETKRNDTSRTATP